MAAGDYTIKVTVGTWSVTLNRGDVVSPTSDAIAIGPFGASWSMPAYPAQPTAETVTFGLYVPDLATGPDRPGQGTRVEIMITTPDASAPAGIDPVLDFVGLITDIDASPMRNGIRFDIIAADPRSSGNEERIGNEAWPAESRYARLNRIIGLSDLPLVVPTQEDAHFAGNGMGPSVAARDVDPQPTRQLLDELLAAGTTWSGIGPAFWTTGWIDGTFAPPDLATWVRPILGHSADERTDYDQFEGGYFGQWAGSTVGGLFDLPSSVTHSTARPYKGAKSLRVTWAAPGALAQYVTRSYAPTGLQVGDKLLWIGRVYVPTGSGNVRPRLFPGATSADTIIGSTITTRDQWTYVAIPFTADATVVSVGFENTSPVNGATLDVDEAMLFRIGVDSLPIVFLPGGLPDLDASLPFHLAMPAGALALTRKTITPDSSDVAWIPSHAIKTDALAWRQDKAQNTNRARVTAPDLVGVNLEHTGSLVAEFPDLVAANGPNELSLSLDAAQGDFGEVTNLLWAMLGTHYDASPRWAMDTFTIVAKAITSGDQWPRLFNPRRHTRIYDQAAGKLVLITDPAAKWNLHDRADYFGRLAGATLSLVDGEIEWTATLVHRLPYGAGKEAGSSDAPVHTPITYAELGANPPNLIPVAAGSFEDGTTGGWVAAGTVLPTLANSTAEANDGTHSLKVTWNGSGTNPQAQRVLSGFTVGQVYTVTAMVKVPTGSPDVRLGAGATTSALTSVKDAWTPLTVTFTAASTTPTIFLRSSGTPAGSIAYLDAVRINLGASASVAPSYLQCGDLTPADLQLVEA